MGSVKHLIIGFPLFIIFLILTGSAQGNTCDKDKVICDWLDKVTIVKSGQITASGVFLSKDLYVTNKHVVEDNRTVQVMASNGLFIEAHVIPNNHESDLVLLGLRKDSKEVISQLPSPRNLDNLRSVAFGVGRGGIRIFPAGELISHPLENLQQARIHSTVRNLPGISGGALINSSGELVGILAAGSGLYNEAIPIKSLNEVISQSLVSEKEFWDRGHAIRVCNQVLSSLKRFSQMPPKELLSKLTLNCDRANNKTLYDIAGQTFGTLGLFDKSVSYLQRSVKLDPNSPTSLISLAVALQFERSYKQQVEVLDHLLQFLQDDPLVLRMSIQAAAFSKNIRFAKKSLELLKRNNPYAYPQAVDFLKSYFDLS